MRFGKKVVPVAPVIPSPITTSIIIAASSAVAYNVVRAVGRWYDRVVPAAVEKAAVAKMTVDVIRDDGAEDDE